MALLEQFSNVVHISYTNRDGINCQQVYTVVIFVTKLKNGSAQAFVRNTEFFKPELDFTFIQ